MPKVVVVRPGEDPVAEEVDEVPTLESMQQLVDGYIEVTSLSRLCPPLRAPGWAVLVCNEEGRLVPLRYNRINVYGTFFICRRVNDELVALDDDATAKILALPWDRR